MSSVDLFRIVALCVHEPRTRERTNAQAYLIFQEAKHEDEQEIEDYIIVSGFPNSFVSKKCISKTYFFSPEIPSREEQNEGLRSAGK